MKKGRRRKRTIDVGVEMKVQKKRRKTHREETDDNMTELRCERYLRKRYEKKRGNGKRKTEGAKIKRWATGK